MTKHVQCRVDYNVGWKVKLHAQQLFSVRLGGTPNELSPELRFQVKKILGLISRQGRFPLN